jgi:acyl CoA:acetate/3-ketoacid CoA transferase alpha subunit
MVDIFDAAQDAVAGIRGGATVMIGGFGAAGQPVELVEALIAGGASDLTVVNNNAGNGDRRAEHSGGRLRRERHQIRCLDWHLVCRAGVHPRQTSAALPDHV